MADIKEEPVWHDGIYQIERNDPVSGGADGVTNKPLKQLANRTRFLKNQNDDTSEITKRALVFCNDNQNYQALNKRIEQLGSPIKPDDAVTKEYADDSDTALQTQIDELKKNTAWGWELIGDFSQDVEITARNQLIQDLESNQYYNWIGELPHLVAAGTEPKQEIQNGEPWVVVDNTSTIISDIEILKQLANEALNKANDAQPTFFGFRKEGSQLIVDTGDGSFNASDYDDWFISGKRVGFSIDANGNLIINT